MKRAALLILSTIWLGVLVAYGLTPGEKTQLATLLAAHPEITSLQDQTRKLQLLMLPQFLSNETVSVISTSDVTQVALQNGLRTIAQRIGLSQTQTLAGMSITISNYVASSATAAIGAQRAMDGATFKGWYASYLTVPSVLPDYTTNDQQRAVMAAPLWPTSNTPITVYDLE